MIFRLCLHCFKTILITLQFAITSETETFRKNSDVCKRGLNETGITIGRVIYIEFWLVFSFFEDLLQVIGITSMYVFMHACRYTQISYVDKISISDLIFAVGRIFLFLLFLVVFYHVFSTRLQKLLKINLIKILFRVDLISRIFEKKNPRKMRNSTNFTHFRYIVSSIGKKVLAKSAFTVKWACKYRPMQPNQHTKS